MEGGRLCLWEKMHLYNMPSHSTKWTALTQYGALTQYAKSQYYMNYQCRAAVLLASFKQEDQDVRNALDSERMK